MTTPDTTRNRQEASMTDQTAEQRMAEVLAAHARCHATFWGGRWNFICGAAPIAAADAHGQTDAHRAHVAAALVAAGFGDVRQAGAEAFVAGWFAHARNPERLVVEDALRAYQRESDRVGGE